MSASPQRKVLAVWLAIGAVAAVIAVPVARPLAVAWRCYQLYAHGEREQAEVIHKLELPTLVLRIDEGSHAGTSCTAGTSAEIHAATERGDRREVVYLDAKPGDCELASTIDASGRFLWLSVGLLAFVFVGLLALGVYLTRTLTRPAGPALRMEADPREVGCPACGKAMDEGYVPLLAGLHWRVIGQPIGLPHALGGLPGTVGRRSRPRLHAFRCVPCEVLTLQYGEPGARRTRPH